MKRTVINGEEYEIDVESMTVKKVKKDVSDDLPYVICRSSAAGVFAGYLVSKEGKEVVMKQARRLWYWKGASSLSELAMKGVAYPNECKFPCPVDKVTLTEVIEILDVTPRAKKCIEGVPEWKQMD